MTPIEALVDTIGCGFTDSMRLPVGGIVLRMRAEVREALTRLTSRDVAALHWLSPSYHRNGPVPFTHGRWSLPKVGA